KYASVRLPADEMSSPHPTGDDRSPCAASAAPAPSVSAATSATGRGPALVANPAHHPSTGQPPDASARNAKTAITLTSARATNPTSSRDRGARPGLLGLGGRGVVATCAWVAAFSAAPRAGRASAVSRVPRVFDGVAGAVANAVCAVAIERSSS